MSREITLSSINNPVAATSNKEGGVSVFVPSDVTLGGGTLNLAVRPKGSSLSPCVIDSLVPGDSGRFEVGANMEIYITVTGGSGTTGKIMIATS